MSREREYQLAVGFTEKEFFEAIYHNDLFAAKLNPEKFPKLHRETAYIRSTWRMNEFTDIIFSSSPTLKQLKDYLIGYKVKNEPVPKIWVYEHGYLSQVEEEMIGAIYDKLYYSLNTKTTISY